MCVWGSELLPSLLWEVLKAVVCKLYRAEQRLRSGLIFYFLEKW